ncbi:hypothetical protein TSOC_010534 [Tetrabaena socialis]|uniref:Uncharacterized protein n=1 Tax=Tetrabaena socialis TaxID=47790 RepID=A0A2J7ZT18_9CHLO|nr:hypothetical protein TSOC_010534 [Tetrabaena socialis]|eukprot:PNH03416.1 hypothetical protein TSOC_010534 [Tetrabaena socialis]
MPQLQDALATAIATVLVNAPASAAAIARALPPLPPADGGRGGSASESAGHCSAHLLRPQCSTAEGAGQLAVTAILIDHLRALPAKAGGGGLATRRAITKLGLEGVPDPDQRLHARVSNKLSKLRVVLGQGLDPFKGRSGPRVKKNTYHWRAWLRQAFEKLPDRTGTFPDAAAIIEADPSIAPLLNQTYPEFEKTGQKRGPFVVFRYNEEAAEEWTARKAKVPKRGVQSLPCLGKQS